MDVETAFGDLGVDAITGVQLMDWLGLSTDELQIPQRFKKLETIIDYLKKYPLDTQRFLVNKVTRGKLVDKLEHMFEYTHLLKQREGHEAMLLQLEQDRANPETQKNELIKSDIALAAMETRAKLESVKDELYLYEK